MTYPDWADRYAREQHSTIRRITVDEHGRILPITNLFDMFGNETTELSLAVTCVVKFGPNAWLDEDVAFVPIYTVH
jgi:hypothetical protein